MLRMNRSHALVLYEYGSALHVHSGSLLQCVFSLHYTRYRYKKWRVLCVFRMGREMRISVGKYVRERARIASRTGKCIVRECLPAALAQQQDQAGGQASRGE